MFPPARPRHSRWSDVRPLDRIRSIKVKLGALIVCSVTAATFVTWLGLQFHLGPSRTYPVAMAIALALTWILARGMTSPLRQMRDSARAMAAGDYSQQVRATSRDEVGQLALAFNAMAADLNDADQARRDLVANVAHELRTPIAALHAQLENIVDGVIQPTPATLSTALSQTERLTRLVTYLLDLSRLEAGAAALNIEEVELSSFLQTCTDASFTAAGSRDVHVAVVVEPDSLTVPADPDRLEQVLTNLLDNAVRHSPQGGTVTIAARQLGQSIVIDVMDEGPGIDAADRERIFARFVRGEAAATTGQIPITRQHDRATMSSDSKTSTRPRNSDQSTTGGTGIGLAIVRWAVELHGGTVGVADSPSGSVMRIMLPAPTALVQ